MPEEHRHKLFSFDEWMRNRRRNLDDIEFYKRILLSILNDKDLYKYKTTNLDKVLVYSSVASISLVLDGVAENLAKEIASSHIKHIHRIRSKNDSKD